MEKLKSITSIFNSFVCNFLSFIGIYAATSATKYNLLMSW
jgi:hypothetical protein